MGTPQYSNDPAPAQGQGPVPDGQAPMPPPPPYRLVPPAGSRLESLRAQLEAARARVAEAEEHATMLANGIKFEAARMAPEGTRSIIIAGGPGIPDWHCHYVESWRLDTQALKDKDPETYVRFAKKGGTWKLEKAGGRR